MELAQALAAGATLDPAAPHADPTPWSGHVIWGNHLLSGSAVARAASVLRGNVLWGTAGVLGPASAQGENDNIVWGTQCGGADCVNVVWGAASESGNVVWSTSSTGEGDNIVWGTADPAEDVLWGRPAHRRRPRITAVLK